MRQKSVDHGRVEGTETEDGKKIGGSLDRRDEVDVVEAAKLLFIPIIKLFCMPEKRKDRHLNITAKGKTKG